MILRYWKKKITEYIGCGNIYSRDSKSMASINISKFSDILNIMIPFFERYPLQGAKLVNYLDFSRVVFMVRDKAHLTKEGCELIRQIKSGMNRQRVYEVPEDLDMLNVSRSSDKFRKRLYLYDAKTYDLVKEFTMQRDLLLELNVSAHTVAKQRDTGLIFIGKYLI